MYIAHARGKLVYRPTCIDSIYINDRKVFKITALCSDICG